MADNIDKQGGEPLQPNEDALRDLELTEDAEDSEADDVVGGGGFTRMCTV